MFCAPFTEDTYESQTVEFSMSGDAKNGSFSRPMKPSIIVVAPAPTIGASIEPGEVWLSVESSVTFNHHAFVGPVTVEFGKNCLA